MSKVAAQEAASMAIGHLINNRLSARILDYCNLVKREAIRPIITGSAQISGSFPSYTDWFTVGPRSSYYIRAGYTSRDQAGYFNDLLSVQPLHWQCEVYKYAREIADASGFHTVLDYGCGSAANLLHHFADMDTLGVDVAATVSQLRQRYPDRRWAESSGPPESHPDLVIASDVIEHLLEPDDLLRYISALKPAAIVLSTPDRNLIRTGRHNGPPMNPAHVREWTFAEFHRYLEDSFVVREHFISHSAQATQCALCTVAS